jgi:uncharacterized protein (DUF2062 family)
MAKRAYQRFIRLKGAPREIALGFSLGLMVGMTPFFGIHIIGSLVMASLLGWSKIAAIIGVNITNVVTAPLIYPLNYWVGVQLVGASRGIRWPANIDVPGLLALIKQSPLVLVDLFVGGIILGLPLAVAGYVVALRTVNLYRKRRRRPSASDQCP